FVRDLLIYNSLRDLGTVDKNNATNLLNHLNTLEKKFEDSTTPQWSFSRMVDELEDRRIIDISDAQAIKNYYKTVRVPIQHGLTRRFLRSHWESFLNSEVLDDLEFLLVGRVGRSYGLENQIEETALDLIKTAMTFIKKYV